MKGLVVQHEALVRPAAVENWLQTRNHESTVVSVFNGDEFPNGLDFDGVIILGGAMSVNDRADHPWIEKEEAWIRTLIDDEVPLLGICLGSQLIASSLGAKVEFMGFREMGWKEIRFSKEALEHPLGQGLPEKMNLLSWHGDHAELPKGAVSLGESKACINQGFILGKRTIGVQFHPEANPELIEQFIDRYETTFKEGGPHIQSAEDIRKNMDLHQPMNNLLYRWLDQLFAPDPTRF